MTVDDPTESPDSYTGVPVSDTDLDPAVIAVLFPDATHEERSEHIYTVVTQTAGELGRLTARIAAMEASLRNMNRLVEGVARLVTTPSGVTLGNAAEHTHRMVKELHEEEFGPPLG